MSEIAKLIQIQKDFVCERDWDQFHSLKNLSVALSVEAAELLEIFRWHKEQQELTDEEKQQVKEEVSDILFFLLRMAEKLDISLTDAFIEKMEKNAEKYPVEKSKGKATKYDKL